MKVIQVNFEGTPGKGYNYYCDFPVEVGDKVVVMARGELALVTVSKVLGVPKAEQERAHSLVVQKIDTSDFEERSTRLAVMIELKNQLKAAYDQHQEMEVYRMMAATNPVIRDLMEQLAKISPESVPQLEGKQ